jgi:hypothetical protein
MVIGVGVGAVIIAGIWGIVGVGIGGWDRGLVMVGWVWVWALVVAAKLRAHESVG